MSLKELRRSAVEQSEQQSTLSVPWPAIADERDGGMNDTDLPTAATRVAPTPASCEAVASEPKPTQSLAPGVRLFLVFDGCRD